MKLVNGIFIWLIQALRSWLLCYLSFYQLGARETLEYHLRQRCFLSTAWSLGSRLIALDRSEALQ